MFLLLLGGGWKERGNHKVPKFALRAHAPQRAHARLRSGTVEFEEKKGTEWKKGRTGGEGKNYTNLF